MILACLIFDPSGPLGALSNYSHHPIVIDGVEWPTVEHFYQSEKYSEYSQKEMIRSAITPAEAKEIAWKIAEYPPEGWSTTGRLAMRRALDTKFMCYPRLRRLLLDTWPMPLFEDASDDSFWGIGPNGCGQNIMGKMLMTLREELKGVPNPLYVEKLRARPRHQARSRYQAIDAIVCYNDNVNATEIMSSNNKLIATSIPDLLKKARVSRYKADDRSARHLQKVAVAFERKYSNYKWSEDARSTVPGWAKTAQSFLETNTNILHEDSIVLGAGAGEEVRYLWNRLSRVPLLCDVTKGLCQNIQVESPNARMMQTFAQALSDVDNESMSTYVALRVYQSFLFDKQKAAAEANRILKQGGMAVISVANGYKSGDGHLVRGLMDANMNISSANALSEAAEIASAFAKLACTLEYVADWHSEIVLLFRKPQSRFN